MTLTAEPTKELPTGAVASDQKTLDATKADPSTSDDGEDDDDDDGSDDKVEISKAELEKLKKERDNYKDGLLSLKKKSKEEKKDDQPKHDREAEKSAIADMTKKHPELDANWDDVIKLYVPRSGKADAAAISQDLEDALTLWKARKSKTPANTTQADLASHSDSGTTTAAKSEETASQGGRKILTKSSGPDSWYSTK